MLTPTIIGVLVSVLIVIVVLMNAIRILPEYERGVVFRLGRLRPTDYGPGLFLLIPIVDRMVRVSLRTVVHDVPPQDVISKDNVSLKVNAVVYFRVMNPRSAIVEVENYKHVDLPPEMQRAMAKQAEAEREKRAKIIHAHGEQQAAQNLALAAQELGKEPSSLQLRYLQTLTEIAAERNSTLIFPLPVELLKAFIK
jgi:regulator of protease activity HflC (stomatin/prohibitin superfamily)